ncbi:MAG: succinylglutamate desuccinylase/aspartoacylase family protein [Planctomycetota bacterium]
MSGAVAEEPGLRRVLGTVDSGRPGPTLLVLAGMHGNEPAGVSAVQRVLVRLQEFGAVAAGRVVALAGNLTALLARQRFVARDLNRGWGAEAIAALAARDTAACSVEDLEQRELLECFEQVLGSASGPVVVVDLHTSSADGPPFACLADTIDNRRLGLAASVPIILGIEESIDGASLEWFAQRGIVAMAIEGGRHAHPDTVANHEAVLWLVLEHLRMLRAVDTSRYRERLRLARASVPPIVEIVQRHAITAADAFRMEPGFTNFAAVEKGRLLARDKNGEIRAASDCRVLLPLYQALGDDGFFIARSVRPVWLHVAKWLRAMRCDALVKWMPGVRRDPADANTILVDPRIARWLVTEIFHLLGFRKERRRGDRLAFTRRWSRPENRLL